MTAKRIVQLAVLLTIICISSVYALGQQTEVTSPKKLNKLVYDGDMAALLSQLAVIHNINIGFETDPAESKPRIKIDTWYDTTEDVLDAIVKAEPKYQWRNLNGFIDIYPREANSAFLDIVINDFQVNNIDWVRASQALTNLPEVQKQMEAMGLIRRDPTKMQRGAEVKLFSLSLDNVTLRQALHEITKRSGNSFWIFQRYGNNSRVFSISKLA